MSTVGELDVVKEREPVGSWSAGPAEYRALARSFPQGFVLLYDRDLRILIADGTELGAFGFTAADLEGRLLRDALPELADELEPRYRRALAGERVSWTRDRRDRTFKLTAGPVEDEDGSVRLGLVVATDITTERHAELLAEALNAIAADVARVAPLEQVAGDVASALVGLLDVDIAAVTRFTAPGEGEILAMAPTLVPGMEPHTRFDPDDESAVARVQRTGEPAVARYPGGSGSIAQGLAGAGLTAGAAAPVTIRGKLWGTIAVAARDETRLTDTLIRRLASFADLVALAVGTTEAWAALSEQATTDELTGLANRRAFFDRLEQEAALARRRGTDLSIALMDLDHFKQVNDAHGHARGDEVLVELAERLRCVTRIGELVARIGGEEFAWVMPGATADEAVDAAERLRRVVEAEPFPVAGSLSVTVGVSTLAADDDVQDLMSRADGALYLGKRRGRNRVMRDLAG